MFAAFETAGHADPAGTWQALTTAWNWAAPLPAAMCHPDFPGATARPAPGGFTLSGLWSLPPREEAGPWSTLPVPVAGAGEPDLFVVASKVLPRTSGTGTVVRLDDLYVPAGFATHTAGAPLRDGDAAFLWTAVAALALGTARRVTDVLAALHAGGAASTPYAAVAAEVAAVLYDERLSLAAALHDVPSARQGLPAATERRLAAHVPRAGQVVQHAVAVAYEHALTADWSGACHPLVSLIEAGSPILQQARYATEVLPPRDRTSLRKAGHGDDRRISG
ncbi:hypothetical protein SAMN06272735_8719 [Streptomyces sp. TLI_55]|uniref:hypothetical protein n=1 Tax=Streptomyces sp. TLI_55 TaxID=1938861 RepID=UPI000BDBFCF3|nr:hypothetical protein [Streptomyces sp. TLI_55]SNX88280.1 hypothetical protein SAMN06272735_8719 [Streptomyces sp. TLI_55]